jgi:hypothetical protein
MVYLLRHVNLIPAGIKSLTKRFNIMATKSQLTKTYSGIFGNQVVLRNRRGRIVMTILPPRPKTPPTAAQLAVRERLKLAARYASAAMKDPVLRARYAAKARKGRSAFLLALIDFLKSQHSPG